MNECKHKVIGQADWVGDCPYCEIDRLREVVLRYGQERAELKVEKEALLSRLSRLDALLTENSPSDVYYDEWDDCGDFGCCGERTYAPHAPDCWLAECRTLAKGEEGWTSLNS